VSHPSTDFVAITAFESSENDDAVVIEGVHPPRFKLDVLNIDDLD
jgi:hypothetical protein